MTRGGKCCVSDAWDCIIIRAPKAHRTISESAKCKSKCCCNTQVLLTSNDIELELVEPGIQTDQIKTLEPLKIGKGQRQNSLSPPDPFEQSQYLPAEITDSFCQMLFEICLVKWTVDL